MIDFDFNIKCTGCSACADVCPKNCIQIIENEYGFFVPQINTALCCGCKKCENVCPALVQNMHEQTSTVYSCYHNDDYLRSLGSSGSCFSALAVKTIENGGVVFGAAFKDGLMVQHIKASTIEELFPLYRSKYVQSDMRGVYREILSEAKKRQVLFCGTPCQCSALNNMLSHKDRNKVLIVDFVCHGVPSQQLFNKCISEWEKSHNSKIESVNFHTKTSEFIHGYSLKYTNSAGNQCEEVGRYDKFPYYSAYKKYFIFRNSCYHCPYCSPTRCSDITISDFWGLEKIDKSVNDFKKGYSMIMINTEHGRSMFYDSSNKLTINQYSASKAIEHNWCLSKSTIEGRIHRLFLWEYRHLPFSLVYQRYFSTKFPIGIRAYNRVCKLLNARKFEITFCD